MGKTSVESDKMFKVSLVGYNAQEATPEQCAVHSGFDYPKIEEHLEGYEEVTIPNTVSAGFTVLKTVNHNYGYKPNVLVYIRIIDKDSALYGTDADFMMLPYFFIDPAILWYEYDVTTTQLKIGLKYEDLFGGGDETPGAVGPAGKKVAFKWQVWVND